MPSTFPEAFGMVAVEAAACGALPVSAGHSGMLEVSRQLAGALPAEVGRLTSFAVEPGAVEAIADRLNGWLALRRRAQREQARAALVETVGRLWSWEGVARGVLAASAANWRICRVRSSQERASRRGRKPPAAASIECPPPDVRPPPDSEDARRHGCLARRSFPR